MYDYVQLCLVYHKAIVRGFFALLIKFKSIVSIKAQVNLILIAYYNRLSLSELKMMEFIYFHFFSYFIFYFIFIFLF